MNDFKKLEAEMSPLKKNNSKKVTKPIQSEKHTNKKFTFKDGFSV